eukprot:m.855195 g.855195  ORF g.855195 m.855195 type:complete len:300 (+) comp59623_c0_seq44:2638-3537(+)
MHQWKPAVVEEFAWFADSHAGSRRIKLCSRQLMLELLDVIKGRGCCGGCRWRAEDRRRHLGRRIRIDWSEREEWLAAWCLRRCDGSWLLDQMHGLLGSLQLWLELRQEEALRCCCHCTQLLLSVLEGRTPTWLLSPKEGQQLNQAWRELWGKGRPITSLDHAKHHDGIHQSIEGNLASQKLPQHDPKAVNVCGGSQRLRIGRVYYFRRHPTISAGLSTGSRQAGNCGETEASKLADIWVAVKEDVLRLDFAVHNALARNKAESRQNLTSPLERVVKITGTRKETESDHLPNLSWMQRPI